MLSLMTNDFFDKFDKSVESFMKRNSFPASILKNMRTDIAASDAAYTVTVDVPGYKKENISISIDDSLLVVAVEKKDEKETKDHNMIAQERCEGRCERYIRLGEDADIDYISAKVEDGVLTITIPRKETPKKEVRKIYID